MESILSGHDGERNDTSMDFDTLFDTKALRIMRVLIPFFPVPYQPVFAVWLRFAQLKHALSILTDHRFIQNRTDVHTADENTLTRLLAALKPCLSESEYQELARMQNMFSMYQRFQQIMPYLSALNGMSGSMSAADIMSAFSAMQGGENTSASDMANAFFAMQNGENSSASDLWNAFSAMQGDSSASAPDAVNAASDTQDLNDENTQDDRATAPSHAKDTDSQNTQNTGSGMDIDNILNLISLFQASSDVTSAEKDTANNSERQDEPEHE